MTRSLAPFTRALAGAVLLVAGPGCGEGSPDAESQTATGQGGTPGANLVQRPPLRDVVNARIAELDLALGTSSVETGENPPAEQTEHVEGLLSLVAGSTDASMRSIGVEEIAAMGDPAVPILAARITEGTSDDERAAALELLAAVDTPAAATALLAQLDLAEEAWVRAHAAWRLCSTQQAWCVPALLRRLKYEKDHDAALWVARALAHFGNYAGLGALRVVAEQSPDERLRASAWARAMEIAEDADAEDPWSLAQAWERGELEAKAQTPRYEREVWRWVARFSEFQLRGVDDARFILERLDATSARWLGEALSDTNVYVRVHTAQSLERMGPRAAPALDALLLALRDPDLGPGAVLALGAIGHPAGRSAVQEAARPGSSPDLRLAALRALGGFSAQDATDSPETAELKSFLESTTAEQLPAEFHQAADESLFDLGARDPELFDRLASYLEATGIEPATTERLLGQWVASLEDPELLEEWNALGRFDELVVPLEKRRAARTQRAAMIRALQAGNETGGR